MPIPPQQQVLNLSGFSSPTSTGAGSQSPQPGHAFGRRLDSTPRVIDPYGPTGQGAGYLLIPEVVVVEDAEDKLMITEHPVEQGAVIDDHAIKMPATVRMQIGWSSAYVGGDVSKTYENILFLQSMRYPFRVITGKRIYDNMLVESIRVHTDAKLEYTFMADVEFREILLVDTTITAPSSLSGQRAAQTFPQSTGPTVQGGTKNAMPATMTGGQIFRATGARQYLGL